METLITYLENLKDSLPVKCTLFNLERLKIKWTDFKNFLFALPGEFAMLKNTFLAQLETIKIKIDAIELSFRSPKDARYAFQEATASLKAEMDIAIGVLSASV